MYEKNSLSSDITHIVPQKNMQFFYSIIFFSNLWLIFRLYIFLMLQRSVGSHAWMEVNVYSLMSASVGKVIKEPTVSWILMNVKLVCIVAYMIQYVLICQDGITVDASLDTELLYLMITCSQQLVKVILFRILIKIK